MEQAALLSTSMTRHFAGGKRSAYRIQQTAVSHVHRSTGVNHSLLMQDSKKRLVLAEAMQKKRREEGDVDAFEYDTVLTQPSRYRASFVGDSKYVHVKDMTMRYDNLTLLDGADLKLSPGRVYVGAGEEMVL